MAFEPACLELALMVRPDFGDPAKPQEIWERAVEDDLELPGTWDTTLHGALRAARDGDWGVSVYLAARCFKGAGAEALGALDDKAHSFLWLSAAEPVVVEVPRGWDRLFVKLDGCPAPEWVPTDQLSMCSSSHDRVRVRNRGTGALVRGPLGSGQYFVSGQTVELSHFACLHGHAPARGGGQANAGVPRGALRRFRLDKDELLGLRRLVPGAVVQAGGRAPAPSVSWGPSNKDNTARMLSSGWFHVVAFPLGGDVTKALLRPMKRQVTESDVLRGLGATLLSQCAKCGQWEFAETLLQAGVPCPDLREEFADVCGSLPDVRRRWLRDLSAVDGGQSQSLLWLAAQAAGDGPLRTMLGVLREGHQLRQLVRCSAGQQPFLESLAEASRWDLVRVLLEEAADDEDCIVDSFASLSNLPKMKSAPPEILELVNDRVSDEAFMGLRARSLKEYFQRQLLGEVMGEGAAPAGFARRGGVLESAGHVRVLERGVRLKEALADPAAEVAFVNISADELEAAAEAVEGSARATMLPVGMVGKAASLQDPAGQGSWLAVLCPQSYLDRSWDGGLKLRIPEACFPTPSVPVVTLVVTTVTECCDCAVGAILVHVNGHRAGVTGADGTLRMRLPPGKHTLVAPHYSSALKTVQVGHSDEVAGVRLTVGRELFVYLHDPDEEARCRVMLCSSRHQIPASVKSMADAPLFLQRLRTHASASVCEFPAVSVGQPCHAAVQALQAQFGLYARRSTDLSKRFLVNFAAVSPKGLLTACFHGWAIRRHQRMNQMKRQASEKMSYHPSFEAVSWVGKYEEECAFARLCCAPLRLGDLITDPPSRPASPMMSQKCRSLAVSSEDILQEALSAGPGMRCPPPWAVRRRSCHAAEAPCRPEVFAPATASGPRASLRSVPLPQTSWPCYTAATQSAVRKSRPASASRGRPASAGRGRPSSAGRPARPLSLTCDRAPRPGRDLIYTVF